MAYNNICRYLTSKYPSAFVKWLLNTTNTNIQILPTELSVEPIRSDALFQLPQLNRILHLEFQIVPTSNPPGLDALSEALLDLASQSELAVWLQSHE